MNVYTAARIEIAWFSAIAFGSGYYWPEWPGLLGAVFLVWVGLTMIKDEHDEAKLRKDRRMLSDRFMSRRNREQD